MAEPDAYTTLAAEGFAESREKGSKFLTFAYPIHGASDIRQHLQLLQELHPKATHHCYAYRYGMGGRQYRANDDGEPSGSAGKPILGQIDSLGLNQVLVVVIRYYGGTKLGVPGLIQAYRDGARAALTSVPVRLAYFQVHIQLETYYPQIPDVMRVGKRYDWEMTDQQFSAERQMISFRVRAHQWPSMLRDLEIEAGGLYPSEFEEGKTSGLIKWTIFEEND